MLKDHGDTGDWFGNALVADENLAGVVRQQPIDAA